MTGVQRFMQRRWQPILLLLLAGGFAMTVLELLLTGHVKGIQLIGVIAPAVALATVVVGLFADDGLRRVLALVLLVVALAGLMGTLQHLGEGGEQRAQAAGAVAAGADYQPVSLMTAVAEQEGDERFESREGGGGSAPPPLAPLAITGLALMGVVVLFVPREQPG